MSGTAMFCGEIYYMKHNELCKLGSEWLKKYGCSIISIEPGSMEREIPDCIGWKGAWCYVIECKTSLGRIGILRKYMESYASQREKEIRKMIAKHLKHEYAIVDEWISQH